MSGKYLELYRDVSVTEVSVVQHNHRSSGVKSNTEMLEVLRPPETQDVIKVNKEVWIH